MWQIISLRRRGIIFEKKSLAKARERKRSPMKNLRYFMIVSCLFELTCCSVLTKPDETIILKEGNYRITKIEKTDSTQCVLECIVYDKDLNIPQSNAFVGINKLKVGGETKADGTIIFKIPDGKYSFRVRLIGYMFLDTKPILVQPNTKTTIIFNLETKVNYSE
jgi:hypothetical protein